MPWLKEVNNECWYFTVVIPLNTHFLLLFQSDMSILDVCSCLWSLKWPFQVLCNMYLASFCSNSCLAMFFTNVIYFKCPMLMHTILSSLTYVYICEPFTIIKTNIFINLKVSLCHFVFHPNFHPCPRKSLICFLSLDISLCFLQFYINGVI